MNDPRHKLTGDIRDRICSLVRAGCFPQVAAEAAGVPVKVFDRWMKWGEAERPVEVYREFHEGVREAAAVARAFAESQALQKSPVTWLKSGPGKETAERWGWTSPVRAARAVRKKSRVSEMEVHDLICTVLAALEDFPEAQESVRVALEKKEAMRKLQEGQAEVDGAGAEGDRPDGTIETNGTDCSGERRASAVGAGAEQPVPSPGEERKTLTPDPSPGGRGEEEGGSTPGGRGEEKGMVERKMLENAGNSVQRKCNESATNGQAGGDGMGGVGRPAPSAEVPKEAPKRGKTVAEVAREMADPRWWSTVYVERW